MAGAMAAQGRFDQAAEMASRVLVIQPANVDAMLELGRAHIARGQAFYGIAALEGARDARPADWRPWSLLGAAYEQVRRHDDAAAAWRQALAISPDNPAVLTNMAMAEMAANDLPELDKGKGNKIIEIPKAKLGTEHVVAIAAVSPGATLLVKSGQRTMSLSFKDLDTYVGARASRGALLPRGWQKVDGLDVQ